MRLPRCPFKSETGLGPRSWFNGTKHAAGGNRAGPLLLSADTDCTFLGSPLSITSKGALFSSPPIVLFEPIFRASHRDSSLLFEDSSDAFFCSRFLPFYVHGSTLLLYLAVTVSLLFLLL